MFDISSHFPLADTHERREEIYEQITKLSGRISLALVMLPLSLVMLATSWSWPLFILGLIASASLLGKVDRLFFEATYQAIYRTPLREQ